jgi:hypothetical protein
LQKSVHPESIQLAAAAFTPSAVPLMKLLHRHANGRVIIVLHCPPASTVQVVADE